MPNFLDQFENKNYKNETPDAKELQQTDNKHVETFSGIHTTEHDVVIDTSYNKHKTMRIAIISVVVLLLCIALLFIYIKMNKVAVLTFEGKNIAEVKTWALKNSIELDEKNEFSKEIDSDIVISQSVSAKEKLSKHSVLSLVVSKGADPEEKINVPDFTKISAAQIQAWIDANKLTNTHLAQTNNDTVAIGKLISVQYRDIAVDENNFRRKDYLTITISKGPTISQTDIILPNFVGKLKSETDSWAATNNVTINYVTEISTIVAVDKIISQSNEVGATIKSGSTITLNISAGGGIVVPDYSTIPMGYAPTENSKFVVTVITKYSNSLPYGKYISQSVKAGERVLPTDNKIKVFYSEGKPYIGSLVGTSEKDLAAYFYAFTQKGANITYTVTYVDSSAPKGSVVSTSKFNEFISMNENVTIQVSKGNLPSSNQ